MMENNKLPLQIYVIWDKSLKDGYKYAEKIFKTFAYDSTDYNGKNIGISVKYLIGPSEEIFNDIENADKTICVQFFNGSMEENNQWRNFTEKLIDYSNDNKLLYLPVNFMLIDRMDRISDKLSKINFIDMYNLSEEIKNNEEKKISYFLFQLAHDIARTLHDRKFANNDDDKNPSIIIFISYARKDSTCDIAKQLNNYIDSNTKLDSFIDVQNIQHGDNFMECIEKELRKKEVVLLAVCTDNYSSRHACQQEVLYAKGKECPIIMLDALTKGEDRRFPYMANEKVINITDKEYNNDELQNIIFQVLIETIRDKYNKLSFEKLKEFYKIFDCKVLGCPPELYTLLKLEKSYSTIIYPDPPLNDIEMNILNKCASKTKFITPKQVLLLKDGADKLADINIGISISELDKDGDVVQTYTHLQSFYMELCRHIFSIGMNVIYAGDMQHMAFNFSDNLINMSRDYSLRGKSNNRIINYVFKDYDFTEEQYNKLGGCVAIKHVDCDSNATNKFTKLREQSYCNAKGQIIIGGKLKDYKGRCPGIIEEAFISINNKKPTFIVGAFGGAAGLLANILLQNGERDERLEEYDVEIKEFLNNINIDSLNNGLTKKENIELLSSTNFNKCIWLITKGLYQKYSANVNQGKLIVFEGIDHVGKSTIVEKVYSKLKEKGIDCVQYSYPGKSNGTLGKLVYDIHHKNIDLVSENIDPLSLQILHIAAHVDLLNKHIIPDLKAGKVVILDRFWWSTIAYGLGDKLEKQFLYDITLPERQILSTVNNIQYFYITRNGIENDFSEDKRDRILSSYEKICEQNSGVYRIKNDGILDETIQKILSIIGE